MVELTMRNLLQLLLDSTQKYDLIENLVILKYIKDKIIKLIIYLYQSHIPLIIPSFHRKIASNSPTGLIFS